LRFLGEELDYEATFPTSDGTDIKVEKHWVSNLNGDYNGKIEGAGKREESSGNGIRNREAPY
jgi:hypothetical protein